MEQIRNTLGTVPTPKERHDGDLSDRLCYPYTTVLFCLFAIVVSTKQFVGDPIQCWFPAHFGDSQESYGNDYCWLGNTYYLPHDSNIPREGSAGEEGEKTRVSYYHWVPIVLLAQALFFYFPKSIWRFCCRRSGLDVEDLVHASQSFVELTLTESREKTMRFMLSQMDRYLALASRKPPKHGSMNWIRWRIGQTRGWYLTASYLMVKVLSLANVVTQLVLLNVFLGTGFHLYGFEVINRVIWGEDDGGMTPLFPRITMCDFKVRRLGANHRYTVQCVLPINLFNEKIFLIVWLWLIFLAVAVGLSLMKWTLRVLSLRSRRHYIKGHLNLKPRESPPMYRSDSDKKDIALFLEKYLHYDGVFVLRMIGHNTSSLAVIELSISMFNNFKNKHLVNSDETLPSGSDC